MAVSSNATRRTLTATLQGHASSVVDTPQDDEEKKIKKMVSNDAHRLARMERYAYVQHGNSRPGTFFRTEVRVSLLRVRFRPTFLIVIFEGEVRVSLLKPGFRGWPPTSSLCFPFGHD